MSKAPDKLVVRAVIPDQDDPSLHVFDTAGRYPAETTDTFTSQEYILGEIGKRVIGNVISIDTQLNRRNIETNTGSFNVADLKAKPVRSEEVQLAAGYVWAKAE